MLARFSSQEQTQRPVFAWRVRICEAWTMPRDKRQKRDLHALDDDGMVLCNPRDKEAAHRAQMEGIATEDRKAVTCRKCLSLLHKLDKGGSEGDGR